MSKCELRVVLDRPDATYRPGDKVRGKVEVSVNDRVTCQGLAVALQWRTEGRSNTARGPETRSVLFQGEWYAGDTGAYPFELEAPGGPFSYSGDYLKIVWRVHATADIPWALDPTTSVEVTLAPPTEGEHEVDLGSSSGNAQVPAIVGSANKLVGGCVGCAFALQGGAFVAIGVGMTLGALGGGEKGPPLPFALIWTAFSSIFFFVGLGMVYTMFLRNRLAQRRLGEVQATVEPKVAHPGGSLSCALRFQPRSSFDLTRATATLRGVERCTTGSGKNSSTRSHTVHEEQVELAGARTLYAGEDVELAGELVLPATAPSTFSASSNHLGWSVTFHLDLPGWPDWQQEVALVVVPKGCRPRGATPRQ